MMKCKKNKLWLENISNLFCTSNLIPLNGMSLAEQMNSLSRLVIIIFFVLFLFKFRFSVLFLLLSLLFIIILYYIQKNNMEQFRAEYYTPKKQTNCGSNNFQNICDNAVVLDGPNGAFNNPNWSSASQKLAGGPNPKTNIPPVIVAPLADLSYWRSNNLVNYSQINEQSHGDLYRSGYHTSPDFTENYRGGQERERPAGITNTTKSKNQKNINNQNTPYIISEKSFDYNPERLKISTLSDNISLSQWSRDPKSKEYNEKIFTQTIQPGIYTRSEINEPINSNIGISFTQQFPQISQKINPISGNVNYTEHDSIIIEPINSEPNLFERATETDIYDPRFTGYGTSYRAYSDDLTGQTRFYYDDVNAIRMPNYISRSNIDHQPFADQYGPIPVGFENGNPYTANIHCMAESAFLNGALQHRTELSERLMRKVNSEHWQRRAAPINKNSSRMMGNFGNSGMT
jgi:Ca2+/Na+ antiporter